MSASVVTAAAALAIGSGIAAPLERLAADALVRLGAARPPQAPADLPDVALVAIDPQSVRALPDWPWPRSSSRRPSRKLDAAGAQGDRDRHRPLGRARSGDDAMLARRDRRSGRVVLAAFRQVDARCRAAASSRSRACRSPRSRSRRRARQRADAGRSRRRRALRAALEPDRASATCRAWPAAALAVARDEAAPLGGPPLRIDWRRANPAVATIPLIDVIEDRFDPRADRGPRRADRRDRRRVPGSLVDAARRPRARRLDPGDRLSHAGGRAGLAPGAGGSRPRRRDPAGGAARRRRCLALAALARAPQRGPRGGARRLAARRLRRWWSRADVLLACVVPLGQLARATTCSASSACASASSGGWSSASARW